MSATSNEHRLSNPTFTMAAGFDESINVTRSRTKSTKSKLQFETHVTQSTDETAFKPTDASRTISSYSEASLENLRSLINECGMNKHCHCTKAVLKKPVPVSEATLPDFESTDSEISLDKRLAMRQLPLSVTERRLDKMQPIKLYPKRVDRTWHKRYNHVLPEDQQFDLQPYDEIQARDEEIALEYFYGSERPSYLMDSSKESMDIRARILHRYNREKRMQEEAKTEVCPAIVHTRVESIISMNRTKAAQTSYLFGPSAAEKAKTIPVINFIYKLCRQRARQKEQQLHPLTENSKWKIMGLESTRMRIKKICEAEKKVQARKKFCRTIKVVRAVVRFIRVISIMSRDARHVLTEIHYFQEHQRLQTQLKIANQSPSQQNAHIASRDVFDPQKYRFSSRFKISPEIRMILTKPWNLRSDEEVLKVVERLQELRCFVEYPVSFQNKLARLAWLIEVAVDLAIIREGHWAADFYFMLAGKAKMIKLHGSPFLQERGTFHVLRIIKNGDAFGDESMSHPDSERTYSVITTEKSILLSLSSVDYVAMLLMTRDDEQAPEHILFLSSLAFLKDFPKQKLIEEGDEYIRNYYLRAGSVITESLSDSEYIYVVKYGSCRVLVEMLPHGAEMSRRRRSTSEVPSKTRLSLRPSDRHMVESSEQSQSFLSTPRQSSVLEFLCSHKDEMAKMPAAMAALKRMKQVQIDTEYQETKAEAEKFKQKSRKMFCSLRPSTIANSADRTLRARFSFVSNKVRRFSDDTVTNNVERESTLSRINSIRQSRESFDFDESPSESLDITSSRHNVEKHLSFIVNDSPAQRLSKVTKSSSGARHAVGTNIDLEFDLERPISSAQVSSTTASPSQSLPGRESPFSERRRSQEGSRVKLPRIDSHTRRDRDVSRKPSQIKCSRWKLIKTMVKGDYIGHEWVDLNLGPYDPPDEEMSLVSDGCEVIMMNRAFLIKYLRKEL